MSFGKRSTALLLALGVASTLLVSETARAAGCATAEHAGGDWPVYGHDLSNTRAQDKETVISSTNVATLTPAWDFSPGSQGGTGYIESTPVIAEGCVYITTTSGYVYALNADDGTLVWRGRYEETVAGVCCGGTMFAPAVHEGVLYINVARNPTTSTERRGPYVLALDSQTGDVLWRSDQVANETGAYTNSSAVYFDGLVFIGISNPEQEFNQTGGFAIVDAVTGEVLVRTRTIPDEQAAKGYGGGAIWSTVAIDPVTKFGFVGTGQPSPWAGPESERVNAIIKIDLDRSSSTFGDIVDSYKATPDEVPYIDVDMAASPTLYLDARGEQMVVDFQKSGWLHAAYTRHMSAAWARPLSPIGTAVGNYSSTATDGTNIFAVGTYPGQMFSINGTTGLPNWVSPVITTVGGNPITYANGLVYHADGKGFLDIYEAATGAPLVHRSMQADVGPACVSSGAVCQNSGGGVAIARNTVYSVLGDGGNYVNGPTDNPSGYLIAYRLA